MGVVSYLQMQVRGPALHGDAQQVINIHSTLPPNNLPYDEPKSHSPQDDLSNDEGRYRDKPFGLKDRAEGYTPLGKSVIRAQRDRSLASDLRSRGTCFGRRQGWHGQTAGLSTA